MVLPRGTLQRSARGSIVRCQRGRLNKGCVCGKCLVGLAAQTYRVRWRNVAQCWGGPPSAAEWAAYFASGDEQVSFGGNMVSAWCPNDNVMFCGWDRWDYYQGTTYPHRRILLGMSDGLFGGVAYTRWSIRIYCTIDPLTVRVAIDFCGTGKPTVAQGLMPCCDSSAWPERGGANRNARPVCPLPYYGHGGEIEFGLVGDDETWSW